MIQGVAEYKELYQRYAQAYRRTAQLEHELRALHAKLLHDADVPAGLSIDYWGDGEAKPSGECAEAPAP